MATDAVIEKSTAPFMQLTTSSKQAAPHRIIPGGSKISRMEKKVENRWRHLARWVKWFVIGLVLLLVGIRLALPFAIKYYVNNQLRKIPEYSGKIGEVRVHLWRGAYEINNVVISKTTGVVPVPLFSVPVLDLSIQWRELFHGAVVGDVLLKQPELNFVEGPTTEQTQSGFNKPWGKTLASLFPFRINEFEIRQGQVHFQNFQKSPPVNIYIANLFSVATNLSNTRDLAQKLPAGLKASGQTLGHGQFDLDLKMDPLQAAPTFELNASLTNVDMVQLNDFLRNYGKLDVAAGNFSMFASVASVQGAYKGYVKVLFRNLDVFAWEKERKKNVLDIFWEAIVGVLSEGFKNHPHDQLAAQIPVSGSFTDVHADLWSASGSLLKNAFIRALVPKLDTKIKLKDVDNKKP
jgi:hypothetical protein